MNVLKAEQLVNQTSLHLLSLDTPSDHLLQTTRLSVEELDKLNSIPLEKRKKEFISSRAYLQQLFDKSERIAYDKYGKPYLPQSGYSISLSHSGDLMAIQLAKGKEVGIDLQQFSPKIERIKKRFIAPEEFEFIVGDEQAKSDYYHILWCAKEALFKWYAKGGLTFNEDLMVKPFELKSKGQLVTYIRKDAEEYEVTLRYEKLEDYFLVYTFNS